MEGLGLAVATTVTWRCGSGTEVSDVPGRVCTGRGVESIQRVRARQEGGSEAGRLNCQ